jgi:hypothetical protein
MIDTLIPQAERIARLNDRVRHGLDRSARTVITHGVMAEFCDEHVPSAIIAQAQIMREIRLHDFGEDAHGERDFGKITFRGRDIYFKIDYFDLSLEYGSEDPADASQTTRVLTIMLSEEY